MAITEKEETSTKERLLQRIERMNETQLLEVENLLNDMEAEQRLERQLKLLHKLAGSITDPEDIAVLEAETRRRPFFGDGERPLDLEP